MSFLSTLQRLQRRRAGEKTSKEENLVPRRRYSLSTFPSLLDSLEDDDREALENLAKATRASAVPFNDGNTNILGQLPGLQVLIAKKKLGRLGLPEEVEPAATQFLNQFIVDTMNGKTTEVIR